jgi:phosphoribosylglycinamide formyltransferase-1
LQALIAAGLPARIRVVVSNVSGAGGLDRARAAGIETLVIPHRDYASRDAFDRALAAELTTRGVTLVCLAGFMRRLGPFLASTLRPRPFDTA